MATFTTSKEANYEKYKAKLDEVTADPNSMPYTQIWRDMNRNGMLSIFGLARWANVNLKALLNVIGDWGFVYARHVTFDSMDECLYYSNATYLRNKLFYVLGNRSIGLHQFLAQTYFTESSQSSSYWIANHIKRILLDDNKQDEYIGHSIGIQVKVDRAKRVRTNVSDKFKKQCQNTWDNIYPKELKPKYIEMKQTVSKHLDELKLIKNEKVLPSLIFSYKLQLRYMDEDRNHHLNFRSYFNYVEEALMNYNKDMAVNRYLNYSVTVVYWKEVNVKKYSYCFVNIYKKEMVFVKEESNGQIHKGYDFYGAISVNKSCERDGGMINDQYQDEWIHHTGFVARCVDKRVYRQSQLKAKL